MPNSCTRVATANASKYLQQLSKHFAHKVAVEYDPHSARIGFPFGSCRMRADERALEIACEAPNAEALARSQQVIDDHLVRFAWRERPEIVWRSGDEG
ncbi:DUF2218 domain-containing protein [Propylenella binzhouense]|uniref:DUF2218 domain-containing protein n=1 Tax=Propylenella binzhouense TaxID=2555902 RepID=A0A964T1M0_9HYPH|nr:DUF2218 domain-containing protein [Propylenella binzhouense]MYZ46781.1 DUF2218 domain-containing protein [Propylenella binzhouense]